jgi:uncharacterized protein YbjT (DUF2867 family)
MFVVLGATGHVGEAVAKSLLADREKVIVVTRDANKADGWKALGAEVAVADVGDRDDLAPVFRKGKRAFLLNPPAPVSTDTNAEEHRTFQAIVGALDGSGLEKLVVQSTYGAQAGERIGDLSVLYDFEQALARQSIPATVQRAAYYMSNWDEMLKPAEGGTLPSMFPSDFVLPMVAPADLGRAAANFLREPVEHSGTHYVEGPERYAIADVAKAFSRSLGRPVDVVTTPRDQLVSAYEKLGFSPAAAKSFARMMGVTLDGASLPENAVRGSTSLQSYIDALVGRTVAGASDQE